MINAVTERDFLFIQSFTGDFQETAKRSGIPLHECYQIARRPVVRAAIIEYFENNKNPLIADRNERLAFWTRVMRAEEPGVRKGDLMIRLRAAELLGKAMLDFGERRVVELEDKRAIPKRELQERIDRIAGKLDEAEDWLK